MDDWMVYRGRPWETVKHKTHQLFYSGRSGENQSSLRRWYQNEDHFSAIPGFLSS
uniref:Uncharacterized protein n=1 Tax=Populus trichocarpa TaxID=3694 RepID=A0A3N7GBH8_POPTR